MKESVLGHLAGTVEEEVNDKRVASMPALIPDQ